MIRSFVIMTALPPTMGHLHLIEFAESLTEDVVVIVSTQPDEPYALDRFIAIKNSVRSLTRVHHFNRRMEQNPEAPGFWDTWRDIMESYGFSKGDYVVASESYGKRLAKEIGGKFMPYDIDRSIYPVKATDVRLNMLNRWCDIIPEFRNMFTLRVTLFGAESTGKTTMTKRMAEVYNAPWIFEWARPYLESLDDQTITTEVMTDIWHGQFALQEHMSSDTRSPLLFQDTDLFSTVGYWDLWNMDTPDKLRSDAMTTESDLYLITKSNIPFEPDPLRYGGDKRESDDQYWIDLCERENLNYRVLTAVREGDRVEEAMQHIQELLDLYVNFKYTRRHND